MDPDPKLIWGLPWIHVVLYTYCWMKSQQWVHFIPACSVWSSLMQTWHQGLLPWVQGAALQEPALL